MTPEPYLLTNAYFKTERAKIHLDELKAALIEFENSEPYTLTVDEDAESDTVRYSVHIRHPHVSIFLIAADIIQCLRASLDQAVWSLANLKHPDPDWTQFPIFREPNDADTQRRFSRQVRGVPDKACAFIESLQPYNRPTGTPIAAHLLWQLHELNRIDKHRRILVRPMITGIARSAFGCGFPRDDFAFNIERTDNGYDVICRGAYKRLKPTLTPVVVFGELKSGINIPVSGIEQIYELIAHNILPTLASLAQ